MTDGGDPVGVTPPGLCGRPRHDGQNVRLRWSLATLYCGTWRMFVGCVHGVPPAFTGPGFCGLRSSILSPCAREIYRGGSRDPWYG